MVEAALLTRGWHLSKEGLEQCKNGVDNTTVENVIRKALHIDLRHIGVRFLPTDLNKGKVDLLQGPCVVQIQKVRNVSAPKLNEDSNLAPPLLRLQLSDGHGTCFALVMQSIQDIGLSTTPGTKLHLKGSVPVNQGFLLLDSSHAKCLGGTVEEMVARWQLQRSLAQHTRMTGGGEGGPPPWVPFGQRRPTKQQSSSLRNGRAEVKKSLEVKEKPKELTEQDKEFEEQRKATIEEVRKAKGNSKTFGGTGGKVGMKGKENNRPQRSNSMDSRKSWNNTSKDEDSRSSRNDGNYRDLSYGGYQPNNQSIQQLMGMGFSRDSSIAALKKHSGNVDQAIESLLDQNNQKEPPPPTTRSYVGRLDRRQDTGSRGGRLGGRGRGRRDQEDENDDGSAAPSGPSTIFDFLETKLPKDKQGRKKASGDTTRNYANEQPKSVREAGIKFVHEQKSEADYKGHHSFSNRDNRDHGNHNRYQDSKEDRTRDGQRNRSDVPKRNTDSFKSGPGRGYDDKPPRFRTAASSAPDSNRQRHQDKYEKPDRTKRLEESERSNIDKKIDLKNKNYEDKSSRNYEDKQSRNYEDERRKKYDEGRNTADERKGGNYDDKGGGRKFYDRKDNRNNDNRENRNNKDRPNQNNRDRDRTREQHQSYPHKSQRDSEPNKPNKYVQDQYVPNKVNKYVQDQYVPNKVNKNTTQNNFSESSCQNGSVKQERKQTTQYVQSNGSIGQNTNQGMSNGVPSPPLQQPTRPESSSLSQPIISPQIIVPSPHSLPVQPLPGQPLPMVSGQMLAPQGIMWKQGDMCQAKYWEDGKMYNAVVTAIHPSGKTCVVHFMEYGNYEEVNVNDMRPTATQAWIDMSQPPPPFTPPGTIQVPMVYENFEGPMNRTLEFRRGGEGSFRRPRENRRVPSRPAQAYYQPPTNRR